LQAFHGTEHSSGGDLDWREGFYSKVEESASRMES